MTRTLWIDARAGASGDMLLAALLDAGAPLDGVQRAVDAVGVEPVTLTTSTTRRQGFAALHVHVDVSDSAPHRTWREVRALLESAPLEAPVREDALAVLGRLARAEAGVHGIPVEQVHLHEVGALDAIADVVGCAAARAALGVDRVVVSPVALGQGWASTAHGRIAVPGPAVSALLAAAGAPTFAGEAPWEACTPTGAALLASWADAWGPQPPLTATATGAGAGSRGDDDDPALDDAARARVPANILRVVVGDAADDAPAAASPGTSGTAVVVETNVDDLDPRLWPRVVERLLAAGAGDAWLTPIVMKKGRPAHTLHVIVRASHVDEVVRVVLTETSAIGVRLTTVGKRALAREVVEVDVDGRTVRVKVARLDGELVNASPELDDVLAAADALGITAKAALARATAAAVRQGLTP